MNKSEHTISFEEWVQTIEFEKGYLKRRREKDAYMENPSYLHPLYNTPLMEPYKPFPNSSGVEKERQCVKVPSKVGLETGSRFSYSDKKIFT